MVQLTNNGSMYHNLNKKRHYRPVTLLGKGYDDQAYHYGLSCTMKNNSPHETGTFFWYQISGGAYRRDMQLLWWSNIHFTE